MHLLEDSLFLLLLPFDGLSGLESALDGSKTSAESLTGPVNESCESRNARLNHGLMRLRDFFILAEPRVVLHPLHNERLHVLVRGILNRLERDDEVDQIAVLLPDTSEVLAVSLVLDPLELGLEVQSVTHLVEQEGEEEVAPARLEGHEAGQFELVHSVGEGVAAGKRVSDGAEDSSRCVEVGQEHGVVQPLIHLLPVHSHVVIEVSSSINRVHKVIDAQVCVLSVRVCKFHSDEERVHLEVVLGGGEGILRLPEVLVSVALADDWRLTILMGHSVEFIFVLLAKLFHGLLVVQGTTRASISRSNQARGCQQEQAQ